jgi:hypothetical protein
MAHHEGHVMRRLTGVDGCRDEPPTGTVEVDEAPTSLPVLNTHLAAEPHKASPNGVRALPAVGTQLRDDGRDSVPFSEIREALGLTPKQFDKLREGKAWRDALVFQWDEVTTRGRGKGGYLKRSS